MQQQYSEYYFSHEDFIFKDLLNPFEACQKRAKLYANATIFVLLHSNTQPQSLIQNIHQISHQFIERLDKAHQKHQQLKFKIGPYTLVQELQQLLQQFQKVSQMTLDDILLGEAFYTWQMLDTSVLLSHTKLEISDDSFLEIQQIDTAVEYPLSSEQLMEWHKCFEENKPQWFLRLPFWAQKALTGTFDLNRPTSITYRGLPGLANTTNHELIISNSQLMPSMAYRMAVPVPFLMLDHAERISSSKANIDQILGFWLKASRIESAMRHYWGYESNASLEQAIKKPLMLFSLLTEKSQASFLGKFLDTFGFSINNNNSRFVADVKQAYVSWLSQQSGISKRYSIFNQGLGINSLRSSDSIAFSQDILNFLEDFLHCIETFRVEIPQKNFSKIHALKTMVSHIKAHVVINDNELTRGRNKNLYLAAVYDLAIRLTGGISIGHCKSSKDRKGMELLYADAMLVFYHNYDVFPAYADQGRARENFLKICKGLFDSGHMLKLINQNILGCSGLKDEGILDTDLQVFLGEAYQSAKLIGYLSEPRTFIEKYRQVIYKTVVVLAVIETAVVGLSWFFHWLAPLNLPVVLLNSPIVTSYVALILINVMVCTLLIQLVDYANFKQKGKSLEEIILAAENNRQSHDKYQKPACISSYNCL